MATLGETLVERHTMGERQGKFREQYKSEIDKHYSGLLHIGVI